MKRMQKLFVTLLIELMIITYVCCQRKSRGHIIIIGGSGGGKEVQEKVVHVPVPVHMPCPMHQQIQTRIQKVPMIIKYPVPVRHPVPHPVPHPIPVPIYKPFPVIKQIPIVKHVPVYQQLESPTQHMYQKIPVFQKEYPDQQIENEMSIPDTHDSNMNNEYNSEIPEQDQSGGGQQESRINLILSKLKIKPIAKPINLSNYLNQIK